ncbi:hypothetical protein [Galbibacter sp.]|uniref:hypothetical protein n=1 Tax=Galbibacter sp. TaxID=2918471 RepID=UPI003A954308
MKTHLNKLNESLPDHIDLFLCNSSFEDRSLVLLSSIDSSKIKYAIICTNTDQSDIVGQNALSIQNKLKCDSEFANFDTNNPLSIADELLKRLSRFDNKMEIVVDITTFTHEALLILLKIFQISKSYLKNNIHLIYNSAKSYCHTVENIDDIWLSKGLRDKRTILGYPGRFKPYNPLHFIMLVGFENERAKHLIESYEPSVLSLGIADKKESVAPDIHEINLSRYKNLKILYKDVYEFTFSCINPLATYNILNEYIARYKNYNVVISPMNNKVSTLGCGLFALSNPQVQLISSRANLYNTESYSKASKYFYKFNLRDLMKAIE